MNSSHTSCTCSMRFMSGDYIKLANARRWRCFEQGIVLLQMYTRRVRSCSVMVEIPGLLFCVNDIIV